jgi:hypothetical protein
MVGVMKLVFLLMIAGGVLPAQVRIMASGNGFQLERGGRPYYIKGAGGTWRMDLLAAAGGNSCRTWGAPTRELLDEAQKHGLTILAGLNVGKPRQGFDYNDKARVTAQREKARQTVRALKGHPALLMWALGNETELNATPEQRLMIWKEVEQLARIVKQEDPDHPVITVIAGAGKSNLVDLAEHCPTLDAVGVNAYGGMLRLPEALAAQGWKKPWLVTEFGPRGHWEVAKTEWGMPIEDTSTEKAAFYEKAYAHAVAGQPRCLGSYVFLWGQKQEKTHTWYGMFLPDGTPLDTVDAISHSWTGQWPKDRAPRITGITVTQTKGRLQCSVQAADPEGGPLKLEWDLRQDVSNNPSTGGDREESTAVLAQASGSTTELKLPAAPGNYRVFVYARDGSGKAATANRAVRVVPE